MDKTVGIVIPAYQPDAERLVQYVDALADTIDPARIHVELDAPDQSALDEIAETSATIGVSEQRRGKGAAVTAGFDRLETHILSFVDADGSTPPSSLVSVLDPVMQGWANLSVGSRRHADAHVSMHQSHIRRRLGDLLATIARRLLPIALTDYQCGAKAIDRRTWEHVRGDLTAPGFAWDIELIGSAHAAGAEITEIPIVWEDKTGSTVRPLRTSIEFAWVLLRTWNRCNVAAGSRPHRILQSLIPSPRPLIELPTTGSGPRNGGPP